MIGQPHYALCAMARRVASVVPGHDRATLQLTGRRKFRRNRGHSGRSDSRYVYEYRCSYCGHVGWSRHARLAERWAKEFGS